MPKPAAPKPVNVLVFVHGMVPDRYAKTWEPTYERFRDGLDYHDHRITNAFDEVVYVHWCLENQHVEPHERLTGAQRFVASRVEYDAVRTKPGPNNAVMSGLSSDFGVPVMRGLCKDLREGIIQFGLADAVYYASADGEQAVRRTVYEQVTKHLVRYESAREVRLHVVAHSLGVTVAHDFLYGLFGKKELPGICSDTAVPETGARYATWRKKAKKGELRLGTFVSFASQLPLFLQRSQALVDRFHGHGTVDPASIGVVAKDRVQWILFYDVDDVLGFATRGLYDETPAIREIQVDCGDDPRGAHSGYWEDKTVLRECAELLYGNATRR